MTGADSMLYRSSDGGQTWKQAISFRSDLQCLYFLNAKQGFVAGILNFGYTLDGGQTWTIKKIQGTLIDTVRSSPQGYFFPWPNLQFVSGSTGYLTTGKGLYMTTDTGSTWTIVNTHPVHAVYFTSATDGYAYYASALIARTGDGGATWQPGVTVPIPSSYNGGNTSLDLLQFTDAEHGWYFAGVNISRTIDGGQTWQLLQNFQTQGYADFQMLSNQLGYICGTTIKKTTDGGNTWQTVADLGTARAVSLFMLDANHGWVCGTNGLVLRFHP
jgi:photosystem II stability/assembly factor-like uncharacterized protein